MGAARHLRGVLLLLGGIVGLAASPVAAGVRRELIARLSRTPGLGDPVSPFREAPCYGRDADGAEAPERRTEAVP